MNLSIDVTKTIRHLNNFWNHIHFHPTDAIEDAWGKRILMIDNWNEWDEGHYVAPSHEFGFRYLQAIREEMTARNNLPDYRTPADLGLLGYNSSWEEPDFAALCAERLAKK